MATGLQRLVRRALLARLKADAGLTALVPAASIQPLGVAAWPFIKLATPTTRRLRATCVNGGIVTWDVHAFAADRKVDHAVVETGEDFAGRIGGEIERVLADNRLALTGATARIRLDDIRLLPDQSPSEWHWFAQVTARVLAE